MGIAERAGFRERNCFGNIKRLELMAMGRFGTDI